MLTELKRWIRRESGAGVDDPENVVASEKRIETSERRVAGVISRFDWFCAAMIVVCGVYLFGSRLLGFYADDAGFIQGFRDINMSPGRVLSWAAHYEVPGRNLHVIWQYLIFAITGGPSLRCLPAAHWLQAFFSAANAALLFVLLRRLSLQRTPSFVAAWLFLLGPSHGEVHYWMSALPMNLISTFFVLCLAISALATVRAALRGEKSRARILFALDGVIFIAGDFTYDQVGLVVATIALVTSITVLGLRRGLAAPALSLAAVVCASLVLVLELKIHALNNGPTFTHVSFPHIVKTFRESLDIVWGDSMKQLLFVQTLPFASGRIRHQAAWGSVAFLCLGLLCAWHDGSARKRAARPSMKRLLLLLIGGVAFFLLAYAPIYLWYISPRHTYLPTIGVAGVIAVLAAAPLSVLQRFAGRRAAAVVGGELILGAAWVVYFLVQSLLVEKRSWVVSYQARKHLYEDLSQNKKFLSASLFVFDSVPLRSPFGTAILGYEQSIEPSLMLGVPNNIKWSTPFSLPGLTGDFIYVELDQWGKNAFLHFPKSKVFRIQYEGLDKKAMRFLYSETSVAQPLVTVEPLENPPPELTPDGGPRLARAEPETLDLSVPAMTPPPGFVVAAIPLVGDHAGAEPLTSSNSDLRRYMHIVELPLAVGRSTRLRLHFDAKLPEVKGVSLYEVGESTRRPLGEVFLPH